MILSKAKHIIASQLSRVGSEYISDDGDDNTFDAVIAKANVSYDRPGHEYTLLTAYNSNIADGAIISGQGDEHFIPLKIDKPNTSGGSGQYIRGYLQQANASGDISLYINPANASKDVWGQPSGTDGTDWGWVIQKTGVYACFNRMEMRPESKPNTIGQIESAEYLVNVPWNVNASFTPIAECRFTDRNSKDWKVLDVDDKRHINQAYELRVVTDDR